MCALLLAASVHALFEEEPVWIEPALKKVIDLAARPWQFLRGETETAQSGGGVERNGSGSWRARHRKAR